MLLAALGVALFLVTYLLIQADQQISGVNTRAEKIGKQNDALKTVVQIVLDHDDALRQQLLARGGNPGPPLTFTVPGPSGPRGAPGPPGSSPRSSGTTSTRVTTTTTRSNASTTTTTVCRVQVPGDGCLVP